MSPDEPLPFKKLGFSPLGPEILPELAKLTGWCGEKAGAQSWRQDPVSQSAASNRLAKFCQSDPTITGHSITVTGVT